MDTQTWARETVEVTDDRSEGWPEFWLIVHAAVDQVGQFGPRGDRQLMVIFIEQMFLKRNVQNEQSLQDCK